MIDNINLEDIKDIAFESGKAVMDIYNQDFDVKFKSDNSPLTKADLIANQIILEKLTKLTPNIPILSEESEVENYEIRKNWEYYWCIDPIDGTKEFVKKNGQFTINIALIYKNSPVLGVVFAPAINDIYYAKKGSGAFKNGQKLPLKINNDLAKEITIAKSNSHPSKETNDFIEDLKKKTNNLKIIQKGSSLKFCLVAEGEVDIYPRFSPIMEWDTAASHSILLESGKNIFNYKSGEEIIYNKKDLHNPWFIVK